MPEQVTTERDDRPGGVDAATAVVSLTSAPETSAEVASDPKLSRADKKAAKKAAKAEARAAKARNSGARAPMTTAEVSEALQLHSPGLVEDLHALSLRQIATEDQRETRLDGKAQGVLITAGLSLTVAFTFGGMLLQHPEYLVGMNDVLHLGARPARILFLLYALALAFGLTASIHAVKALYVTDAYRGVDERDVLNRAELRGADDEMGPEGAVVDDKKKQSRYRRYVTLHFWQIWQQHYAVNEKKATRVKKGQRCFLWFLALLMAIGIAMAFSAVYRFESPPVPAPNGATP